MFDKISEMGAYNLSYKYFTTGEIADVMGPVYGMVQCTRDLSQNDCFKCLNDSLRDILNCCVWATTAAALRGSCVLRYDWQKFYDSNPNWIWNVRTNSDPGLVPLSPQPVNHSDSSYSASKKGNGNKTLPVALGTSISIVFLAVFVISIFIFIKRRKRPRNQFNGQNILENVKSKKSLLFEFSALEKATNNFSNSNILGAGGFGPVYKGKLLDGKEIAVKRLARGSEQGLSELTNEVQFLAELQHKNLVRLFGVCLEKNEMLLVYEYIRNKSLDTLLFDDTSGIRRLNWEERLKIIQGISKGLLYLHQDSAIRLIHRDLKASNILIDGNMNPKISDFGLARLLGGDHTQSKTTRVVGTYGYMAPEYAIQGTVSTKVDIFSFGVLILEIISGKRNGSFSGSNEGSLINYAWGNWRNSTVTNIIDQSLGDESGTNLEAVRCINIGLLCVQENPNKRPDINLVNLMLTRQRMKIPQPSSPAFIFGDYNLEENSHASSSISSVNFSANYVSCSEVYPR
ncbi:hypothetical protein LUZ60_010685 [Juncus effusus]|nr:hypothetical protein LUZ60_010685 [Juncus effusus]